MPVALDHLRSHGRRLQTKPRADALLVLRLQMPECPHRAGELPHAHIFGSRVETDNVALDLRIPVQQLEAKGRRLGMNAMRAPNRRRVLELDRPPSEHLKKCNQSRADQDRSL